MRIARIAAMVLTVGATSVAHADFTLVSPTPTGNDLTGVFGLGKDVFVVGANATALVTHDRGATWKPLAIGTTLGLHGIWGVGKDVYIAAENNTIVHSHDGGATWVSSVPPTHRSTAIEACWGPAADDVTCVGVNGVIAHTIDRGKTWTSENQDGRLGYQTFYAIGGRDHDTVFAVGESGAIAQRDHGRWLGGGRSTTAGLRAIATVGTGSIAVGEAGRVLALDATGHPVEQPPTTDRILRGVWSAGDVVLAVGEATWSKAADATRGTLLRSTDAGKTWAGVDSKLGHHLASVWGDRDGVWVVGDAGELARSTDAGATWQALGKRNFGDGPIAGIAGRSTKLLVASGSTGLARSLDGGKTWVMSSQHAANAPLTAIPGGFAALDGWTFLRSVDGAAWTSAPSVSHKNGFPLSLAAASTQLVGVANDRRMVQSRDAGEHWVELKMTPAITATVAFASASAIYVAGEQGGLVRFDAAGSAGNLVVDAHYDLEAGYADGKTLVVVGHDRASTGRGDHGPTHGQVLISHDDGATWKITELARHYDLGAIAGASGTLVVAGDHGGVERSTDGGKTWTTLPLATAHDLTALWTDGTKIVVGSANGEVWIGP